MAKDREIVERVLSGEINMYELLIRKYEDLIKSIIYGMIYDAEETKDITQDVFLRVYDKLKRYNPEYSFKSWITRIAKNYTIDYLRKTRSHTSMEEVDPARFSYIDEDYSLKDEMKRKLELAMLKLDEENRILLYLKYHESYTNSELSDVMEIPMKNIRLRIFRAKEKLRKILENDDYFRNNGEARNG